MLNILLCNSFSYLKNVKNISTDYTDLHLKGVYCKIPGLIIASGQSKVPVTEERLSHGLVLDFKAFVGFQTFKFNCISQFHNHAQLLKVKNSGRPLDNQPAGRSKSFQIRITVLWPEEHSVCQNCSLLATAHDCDGDIEMCKEICYYYLINCTFL